MPEFVNPFSQAVPGRTLSKEELIRAIRLDIAAEQEATSLYMAHAEAVDDPLAKQVLTENREQLDRVTKHLLERETLSSEEFEAAMEGRTLPAMKDNSSTPQPQTDPVLKPSAAAA